MPSSLEQCLRILLAAALGAAIGTQRELTGRPAGMRTLALVSTGSALFGILSMYGFVGGNPAMIAAGVVTGVGFLGAGAILHHRSDVEGLTTAAAIWLTSAIGLAAGAGFYLLSVVGTIIALIILFLPHLKSRINPK